MATFNMRIGLKNEMRTKSPYENHPTLMQMHNNVIYNQCFYYLTDSLKVVTYFFMTYLIMFLNKIKLPLNLEHQKMEMA